MIESNNYFNQKVKMDMYHMFKYICPGEMNWDKFEYKVVTISICI